MSDNSKTIQQLQYDVCKVIANIGGKVTWAKEFGWLARLNYKLSGKEPVLNIEALFLGEKFGVVLTGLPMDELHLRPSKHRIIIARDLAEFKAKFDALKAEKLNG